MIHATVFMAAMLLNQIGVARQCQTVTSYQTQHYVQAPQTYVKNNAYVEKVLFLPVEREDPYYAAIVHDKLRQEARITERVQGETDLASQVAKLSESIINLEKRFGQLLDTPSPIPPNTPGPGEPAQPPPTSGEPVPPIAQPPVKPDAADVVKLKQDVATIFAENCAKCHTGESAAKGFVMFDDNDKLVEFSAIDKALIDIDVRSGRMPKNSRPLTDDKYSKISAWSGLDGSNIVKALLNCKEKGK